MYGSVGAGIALLVWMYVLAIIALIGCEFNAESRGLDAAVRQAGREAGIFLQKGTPAPTEARGCRIRRRRESGTG